MFLDVLILLVVCAHFGLTLYQAKRNQPQAVAKAILGEELKRDVATKLVQMPPEARRRVAEIGVIMNTQKVGWREARAQWEARETGKGSQDAAPSAR